MSYKKIIYRKRDFLNKEEFHSLAAIFGEIVAEWNSEENMKMGLPPTHEKVTLNISDCNRKIDLQFDTKSEDERQNSLEKITKLFHFIKEFKEHFYSFDKMIDGREKLQEKNNLSDTIFDEIDKWFENNLYEGNKPEFDLEIEEHQFLIWVNDDIIGNNINYWHRFTSFIKELREKYNVNIFQYNK